MSDSIIQVRNLGKSYIISHEGSKESYTALRDVVANKAKKIFSFPKGLKAEGVRQKESTEEFWALKDVSFNIQQGDRVGIIGRNGAGKSTLLKILSRITEPTTGEIRIKGRVASLLEVGTGFHPELTGRENIYLNGAILGMSRAEIKRKFHEIVDFAEVEKFLDTPVKRYSSGMYVRLAFAVAAHLEPEILVVDEVLAVGDAQFQKKCLGKMEDVSKNEGRTVLFVSHNMGAISQLCNRGIVLLNGKLDFDGNVLNGIQSYMDHGIRLNDNYQIQFLIQHKNFTDSILELTNLKVLNWDRNFLVKTTEKVEIDIEYTLKKNVTGFRIGFDIFYVKEIEQIVFRTFHDENDGGLKEIASGKYYTKVIFPANMFRDGIYRFNFIATVHNERMITTDDFSLDVIFENVDGVNSVYNDNNNRYGCIMPKLDWQTSIL